jgi:hypothetical protein
MPDTKVEAICPECDAVNNVSVSDLYAAKASGGDYLMVCISCGRASKIANMAALPAANIQLVDWAPKVNFDGANGSWLQCIRYTGPDAFLPSGAFVAAGDEAAPQRLWLYSTANLDKSPDGTKWWKWEDFVRANGVDAFNKLSVMRGPAWVKFMTKGKEPHVRTRLVKL